MGRRIRRRAEQPPASVAFENRAIDRVDALQKRSRKFPAVGKSDTAIQPYFSGFARFRDAIQLAAVRKQIWKRCVTLSVDGKPLAVPSAAVERDRRDVAFVRIQ